MSEYKTGRIYKIVCALSNDVYVGSTFNILAQRWVQHKNSFSSWLNNSQGKITIFPLMEKYGIENFKIMLIKEYQVCDRHHLEVYETLWIYKLKSCNRYMPFQIRSFYMKQYNDDYKEQKRKHYQKNKEEYSTRNKQYHEEHKEQIAEWNKQYQLENREQIAAKHKQYREENKEQLASYFRQYQQKNRERIAKRKKQPFTCECGTTIRSDGKIQHFKTKKHLDFIHIIK